MAKYHENLLRDSTLSLLFIVKIFTSLETKMILKMSYETFLRITRYHPCLRTRLAGSRTLSWPVPLSLLLLILESLPTPPLSSQGGLGRLPTDFSPSSISSQLVSICRAFIFLSPPNFLSSYFFLYRIFFPFAQKACSYSSLHTAYTAYRVGQSGSSNRLATGSDVNNRSGPHFGPIGTFHLTIIQSNPD